MNVYGQKIYLRAMEPEDMECFREMLNDPGTARMVVGWSHPASKLDQQKWYERTIGDSNKRFSVVLIEGDRTVGMVALTDIDLVNRNACYGIKLHPSCPRMQGIGTDALMTLMEYAFNQLNLNRLDTEILLYNVASRRLHERCGWHEEGIKKQAVYRDGQYHDLAIFGILKSEFLETKETLGWAVSNL